MYKLEKRIEQKGRVKKYVLKNTETGEILQVTPEQFRNLVQQKAVVAVRMHNNRLGGAGLRCIVENTNTVISVNHDISLYTGTEMLNFIRDKLHGITKHRSEYNTLMHGIVNAPHNITVISGTRRTGKTVLMLQAIRTLAKKTKSICYININTIIDFDTLYTYLLTNCKQYKYVFIDEITFCKNFVEKAAILSDVYCYIDGGHKLILTGTESFAFCMTHSTTLYERATTVNTSLLLYSDYYNLFAKSFEEYYKRANMYENYKLDMDAGLIDMLSITYINNICNTIQRNDSCDFAEHAALCNMDTMTLKYCLFQIFVKGYSNSMSLGKINGNAVVGVDNKTKQQIKQYITQQIITSLLRDTVDTPKIETAQLRTVYSVLLNLGALYNVRNVYLFNTDVCKAEPSLSNMYIVAVPSVCYALSLRYNKLLESYCVQNNLQVHVNDNYGHLLENAVIANLCKLGYDVRYYRDDTQREVDCVIYDEEHKKVFMLEIKSSNSADSHHTKNISDETVTRICTVGGKYQAVKYVLYMGETVQYGAIKYINITDFLRNVADYLR